MPFLLWAKPHRLLQLFEHSYTSRLHVSRLRCHSHFHLYSGQKAKSLIVLYRGHHQIPYFSSNVPLLQEEVCIPLPLPAHSRSGKRVEFTSPLSDYGRTSGSNLVNSGQLLDDPGTVLQARQDLAPTFLEYPRLGPH